MPQKIKTAVTLHKVYGWIYIAIAALMLLGFVIGGIVFGFAASFEESGFGSLFFAVFFGFMGLFVGALIGAIGALHLYSAKGIEERKEWGKIMGIIMGAMALGNFPLGTIIGIFILIGLFDKSANEWFVKPAPEKK